MQRADDRQGSGQCAPDGVEPLSQRTTAGEQRASDPRRRVGDRGERLARAHLEARGFEIIDANFRTRHGELDLIALGAESLIFCEVKTRLATAFDSPELGPFAAIGARKRRRIRLIAREWLALQGPEVPWRPEIRFDAIGIELDRQGTLIKLDHLEGAF